MGDTADRFDLSVASERRLWKKDTPKEPTVLQSSVLDEVHKHLHVRQLVRGGSEAGDLCLNRLDLRGDPPADRGDTHVSCLHIRTGEPVQRERTEAGHSLSFREPEGLAVRRTPKPWLCRGFASGAVGAREFSVCYKPHRP
ncbi:hypothetical protein [Streptomyces sp. bgisy027]|uniref:hypothetical protein n=1 Tax=unclassified Streptomyces TaxID=2593676 RepID=UPI003D74211F